MSQCVHITCDRQVLIKSDLPLYSKIITFHRIFCKLFKAGVGNYWKLQYCRISSEHGECTSCTLHFSGPIKDSANC